MALRHLNPHIHQMCIRDRVEGALNHRAGHHVLNLGADKSRALAGLDVLEVNDGRCV